MDELIQELSRKIRSDTLRELNLTNLFDGGVTNAQLDRLLTALVSGGYGINIVILDNVNLSTLSSMTFLKINQIISLSSPSSLSLRNTHLADLDPSQAKIFFGCLRAVGLKSLDLSENYLPRAESETFIAITGFFTGNIKLSTLILTDVGFTRWTSTMQRRFWHSVKDRSSLEFIYLWQNFAELFTNADKEDILDELRDNFNLTFMGLYPENGDSSFAREVEGICSRNQGLGDWICRRLRSGRVQDRITVEGNPESDTWKVADWSYKTMFAARNIYDFYNAYFKQFCRLVYLYKVRHGNSNIVAMSKASDYMQNNMAVTSQGKAMISKAFQILKPHILNYINHIENRGSARIVYRGRDQIRRRLALP